MFQEDLLEDEEARNGISKGCEQGNAPQEH